MGQTMSVVFEWVLDSEYASKWVLDSECVFECVLVSVLPNGS